MAAWREVVVLHASEVLRHDHPILFFRVAVEENRGLLCDDFGKKLIQFY